VDYGVVVGRCSERVTRSEERGARVGVGFGLGGGWVGVYIRDTRYGIRDTNYGEEDGEGDDLETGEGERERRKEGEREGEKEASKRVKGCLRPCLLSLSPSLCLLLSVSSTRTKRTKR
jgi:hypothetical protein